MAVPSTSNSRGGGIDYIHIFTQNMLLKIRTGYTQIDINSLPLNYGTNLDNKIGVVNGNLGDAKYSALSPAYLLDGSAAVGDGAFVPIHNPPGGGTADTKEREPAAVTHIFASKQMRERSLPGTQYGGLVAYSYPPYVGWALHINFGPYQFPWHGSGKTHFSANSYDRHVPLSCLARIYSRDVPWRCRSGRHCCDVRFTATHQSSECSGGRVLTEAIRTEGAGVSSGTDIATKRP